MYIIILLIAAVVFVGYAVFTQYKATPFAESVPKRVWASVVAASMAIGAAVTAWLHSVTAP